MPPRTTSPSTGWSVVRPCFASVDRSTGHSRENRTPSHETAAAMKASSRARSTGKSPSSVAPPSAGLAFTLTIIDLLTEGELTGGGKVAVTGTISAGGSVGDVGGVAQKARAAEDAGVEVFIVPVDAIAEAESTTERLRIEGVATLDEAIAVLAGLGGDVSDLALQIDGFTVN